MVDAATKVEILKVVQKQEHVPESVRGYNKSRRLFSAYPSAYRALIGPSKLIQFYAARASLSQGPLMATDAQVGEEATGASMITNP